MARVMMMKLRQKMKSRRRRKMNQRKTKTTRAATGVNLIRRRNQHLKRNHSLLDQVNKGMLLFINICCCCIMRVYVWPYIGKLLENLLLRLIKGDV